MSPQEFDKVVHEVWQQILPGIPNELKNQFQKIQIIIEDIASDELLADFGDQDLMDNPIELCGFYTGTPLTEALITMPDLMPGRVYLFREALLELVDYDETPAAYHDLKEEIAITLLHEIGHFFGLDEEDLERLGFD